MIRLRVWWASIVREFKRAAAENNTELQKKGWSK